MKTNLFQEPGRAVAVAGTFDVLVCGGGPAGVAAAVAAARAGARTGLIESHGCLGGIWTAGHLCWILDHKNKTGFMLEILERLESLAARSSDNDRGCDVEKMKLALEAFCVESKVYLRYYTRAAGAAVNSRKQLTHVITESKSGREAFAAKVFIDCTGDGDLAAAAGCGFDLGNPETGLTQPMSLIAAVIGLDPRTAADFYYSDATPKRDACENLRKEMERAGIAPSYGRPTLMHIRDELFMLMANHEYLVLGTSADDLTKATIHARAELHRVVEGLRALGGVWKNMRIVVTSPHIGVREGRRIHGLYTVSAADLEKGARHADAVCRVTFGVDVHSTDPAKTTTCEPPPFVTKPYDIPLRALIAKDVDNLMMAGRCISGDFLAHSSYRVTGNAVALGEAAGRAAARAALSGKPPAEITELRQG